MPGELRCLARGYLRREKSNHTLQSTALVNESRIRLIDQSSGGGGSWHSRAHVIAIAARLIRQIVGDQGRSHQAEKRGAGSKTLLSVDEAPGRPRARRRLGGVVARDDALRRLAELEAEPAQIIEMRFFGGLTIEETATVKRDGGEKMAVPRTQRELRA